MKKIISILLILCMSICMMPTMVSANNTTTYVVNCSALNVRTQPSTQSSIIGLLYRGNQIVGGQSSNGWTPIVYNGKNAFVYSAYLTTKSNNTNTNTNTGTLIYIGTYRTTGYDICYSCCGKVDGITASGTRATPGRTVAMKGYPYGTRIYIEGIGYRTVEDTGGFRANTIDVLCNNHSECYAITGYRKVYLVK